MANTSINLVNLDFEELKTGFKDFLATQSQFKDYSYEGSNMSVLLDVLAYNTYMNAFYLNMVANEMFLDTSVIRENIVARTKELNYLPRSFQSSRVEVDISIKTDGSVSVVNIPKNTAFTTRIDNENYVFVTDSAVVASGPTATKTTGPIFLYEGAYYTDTFIYSGKIEQRFILNNPTIDTDSLTVVVIEDNGGTTLNYTKATSLFDKTNLSQIYFLQLAENNQYEIRFGDGVTGRQPKKNSVILCEYRVTSGELPNGAFDFKSAGAINGFDDITVTTIKPAESGLVGESIESIKYNAPRYFTSQERAITEEDYSTLLKLNYPEINTVNVFGGEKVNPPQYGKVYVAVDLKAFEGVPDIKKEEYQRFLKSRCSLSIDPVLVDPEFTYVAIKSLVRYNVNLTEKTPSTIRTLVSDKIRSYNETRLNDFNKTLRYSELLTEIDNTDESIISNDTEIQMVKYYTPIFEVPQNITFEFGQKLENDFANILDRHPSNYLTVLSSNKIVVDGIVCEIEDDGLGNVMLISGENTADTLGERFGFQTDINTGNAGEAGDEVHAKIRNIGTIDYTTGRIDIIKLKISSIVNGGELKVFARPKFKDIFSSNQTILTIRNEDLSVSVSAERE